MPIVVVGVIAALTTHGITGCGGTRATTTNAAAAPMPGVATDAATSTIPAFGDVEIVAALAGVEASGIVLTEAGRIFVTLPRIGDDHDFPVLAELVDGRPLPFPDGAMTLPSDRAIEDRLVSPLGLTRHGSTLWVLDEGKRAGMAGIPDGGAKLVGIDIEMRKVVTKILFRPPFFRDSMRLTDLRFDPGHGEKGTIYISNDGFDGADSSLLVVDIATAHVRERLRHRPEVSPAPGFMTYVEGVPHAYRREMRDSSEMPILPQGGVRGVELSRDGRRLYWTIPTNPEFYSLPTDWLADDGRSDEELRAAVYFEGETASTGGIAVDAAGALYFSDASRYSIIKKDSRGNFSLVARDARLTWPEGMAIGGGYLYVTIGRWQRLAGVQGTPDVQDARGASHLVLRVRLTDAAR